MYVDILGAEYEIIYKEYSDEPYFEDKSCDGFCDSIDRKIVICILKTHPNYGGEKEEYCKKGRKVYSDARNYSRFFKRKRFARQCAVTTYCVGKK